MIKHKICSGLSEKLKRLIFFDEIINHSFKYFGLRDLML